MTLDSNTLPVDSINAFWCESESSQPAVEHQNLVEKSRDDEADATVELELAVFTSIYTEYNRASASSTSPAAAAADNSMEDNVSNVPRFVIDDYFLSLFELEQDQTDNRSDPQTGSSSVPGAAAAEASGSSSVPEAAAAEASVNVPKSSSPAAVSIERKRELNRLAARKYRMKRKMAAMETENMPNQTKNDDRRASRADVRAELRQQNEFYIQLLKEAKTKSVQKRQGQIAN